MDKELVKLIAEYGGAGAVIVGLLIFVLRDTLNQKLGTDLPASDRVKISKYLLVACGAIACVSVLAWAAVNFNPTLKLEAPDEPITINMNIKLDADVRLKVEEDLKTTLKRSNTSNVVRPEGFGSLYGEKYDGYLGVIKEQSNPEVEEYVKKENEKRLKGYVETAGRLGMSVYKVSLVAGDTNIKSLPKNVKFMSKNDEWTSK